MAGSRVISNSEKRLDFRLTLVDTVIMSHTCWKGADMTSRQMGLAVALSVLVCLTLTGCDGAKFVKGGGGAKMATSHTLTIIIDGNNTCTQSLDGATAVAGMVHVTSGDSVAFQGQDPSGNNQFALTFAQAISTCGSPFQFYGCTAAFSNAATTGGMAGNQTFPYQAVSVGNPLKNCSNPKGLGIVLDH
jgi:hypothetical protein